MEKPTTKKCYQANRDRKMFGQKQKGQTNTKSNLIPSVFIDGSTHASSTRRNYLQFDFVSFSYARILCFLGLNCMKSYYLREN